MQLNLNQLIDQLTRIRDKYDAGEALVETRYEEDIDLVEEIITSQVISVETPPKLQPNKVIINMDKPRPKYY
ncbi:MAG: hypothetical protein IKN15_04960 [Bacteroidaceae bacterium]|nr:hypothetical protein [Bacteroidaceae bacterium]